jgi:acetyl/propionyl-CoA carboxylase alpha subunit
MLFWKNEPLNGIKMIKIKKVLIANRGEIAVRIIKTLKKNYIGSVVIYSESDKASLAVSMSDEAVFIGSDILSESYLNINKIVRVAIETGCDALHPGYGFLSENPALAFACKEAGIVFIGPSEEVIQLMGNKLEARNVAISLKIPVIAGSSGPHEEIIRNASGLHFPLLVKAAGGGGGKGMRIVKKKDELKDALIATAREAKTYFGDETVYVEQYIERPRHIEVQILGDTFGNIVHLFERECTIQRRHQKIIEEAPSVTLNQQTRERLTSAAIKIAQSIQYVSAGTIEFLVDSSLNFYFLEMNTRIQVEHPVTEFITGIDIVEQQLRIASGLPLAFNQNDLVIKGHAIECRLYAEDPENDFRPSPGRLLQFSVPLLTNDYRLDSGIEKKGVIESFFDPMIAKLIVHGDSREQAIEMMQTLLHDTVILGIKTNREFLCGLLAHSDYLKNNISVTFAEEQSRRIIHHYKQLSCFTDKNRSLLAFLTLSMVTGRNYQSDDPWNMGFWRNLMSIAYVFERKYEEAVLLKVEKNIFTWLINKHPYTITVQKLEEEKIFLIINNQTYCFHFVIDQYNVFLLYHNGFSFKGLRKDFLALPDDFAPKETHIHQNDGIIVSPVPGKISKIFVKEGDVVNKETVLLVVESMKMENNIYAFGEGTISKIFFKENDAIETKSTLMVIELFQKT